jgi:hypothetical protein
VNQFFFFLNLGPVNFRRTSQEPKQLEEVVQLQEELKRPVKSTATRNTRRRHRHRRGGTYGE